MDITDVHNISKAALFPNALLKSGLHSLLFISSPETFLMGLEDVELILKLLYLFF